MEPPRWARRFVLGFLAAFVACGLFGIEAWPLTGWRLFSQLRTDHQVGWQASYVDDRGRVEPIPFGELPLAYRGSVQILAGFGSLPPRDQEAVCAAWAAALAARGHTVRSILIERLEWNLSRRQGDRAAPARRAPRWACAGGSVVNVEAEAARGPG